MPYTWTRDHIVPHLLHAGHIALQHYDTPGTTTKPDGSVVTLADRAIETYMTDHLADPAAHIHLLGEETAHTLTPHTLQDGLDHHLLILDPIDGTAPYAAHIPIWGVSLGYAHRGTLTEGAVYLPITGELFISEGPTVYLATHVSPSTDPAAITYTPLTHPIPAYDPATLISVTQSLAKAGHLHLPNPVHALACAVVPLTYLLLGRYAAYIAQLKLWDLAGALPLLHKRGIHTLQLDPHHTPLTPRITPHHYTLDLTSPRAFAMHHPTIFAPAPTIPTIKSALT